ncbi:hypothetical protein SAMN04487773_0925, partial [Enterobacter sp. kpr-6]
MAWYKNGTVAISGVTVTGTGTNWTDNKSGIGPGQALLVPAAGTVKMYEILSVDSATKLTLTSSAGAVAAGSAYAILSFYTDSVPDFARRLSAQLTYYQSQMDGWQQIMTGTGNITIEAPDGTLVTLSSFKKLTTDMGNKADLINGVVPVIQGGTGGNNAVNARAGIGAAASGDNTDITSLSLTSFRLASNILFTSDLVEVGGSAYLDLQPRNSNWVKLRIIGGYNTRRGINGVFGGSSFNFDWGGPTAVGANPFELWVDGSRIGQVAFTTSSDKYLKKDIEYQDDNAAALEEVMQYRAASFKYRARGILEES